MQAATQARKRPRTAVARSAARPIASGEVIGIESQRKAVLAATAALAKHAEHVLVLDVRKLSSVTDWYVLCTGMSPPQLVAIREAIDEALRAQGQRPWHVEGESAVKVAARAGREGQQLHWILMDCGDVVVHLFNPPARQFYQLERLWGDAPQLPLDP